MSSELVCHGDRRQARFHVSTLSVSVLLSQGCEAPLPMTSFPTHQQRPLPHFPTPSPLPVPACTPSTPRPRMTQRNPPLPCEITGLLKARDLFATSPCRHAFPAPPVPIPRLDEEDGFVDEG